MQLSLPRHIYLSNKDISFTSSSIIASLAIGETFARMQITLNVLNALGEKFGMRYITLNVNIQLSSKIDLSYKDIYLRYGSPVANNYLNYDTCHSTDYMLPN